MEIGYARVSRGDSARRGDEQNRWLAVTAIVGVIVGMALVGGACRTNRTHHAGELIMAEKIAARTLDRPMWDAGQRMMTAAAPESWRAIVAGDKIMAANRDTIEGCKESRGQSARGSVVYDQD